MLPDVGMHGENVFKVSKCVDVFYDVLRFFCQLVLPCRTDLPYTIPTSVLVFAETFLHALDYSAGSTLHISLMLV